MVSFVLDFSDDHLVDVIAISTSEHVQLANGAVIIAKYGVQWNLPLRYQVRERVHCGMIFWLPRAVFKESGFRTSSLHAKNRWSLKIIKTTKIWRWMVKGRKLTTSPNKSMNKSSWTNLLLLVLDFGWIEKKYFIPISTASSEIAPEVAVLTIDPRLLAMVEHCSK